MGEFYSPCFINHVSILFYFIYFILFFFRSSICSFDVGRIIFVSMYFISFFFFIFVLFLFPDWEDTRTHSHTHTRAHTRTHARTHRNTHAHARARAHIHKHTMVSRRKILSRSRDNLVESQYEEQEEEDVWYNLDKLYKVRLHTYIGCNEAFRFYNFNSFIYLRDSFETNLLISRTYVSALFFLSHSTPLSSLPHTTPHQLQLQLHHDKPNNIACTRIYIYRQPYSLTFKRTNRFSSSAMHMQGKVFLATLRARS